MMKILLLLPLRRYCLNPTLLHLYHLKKYASKDSSSMRETHNPFLSLLHLVKVVDRCSIEVR